MSLPVPPKARTEQSVFSVPMELHVIAESAEAALAIAHFMPHTIHGDDGASGSLYVATDQTSDIDCVES